eukprot:jgi/Botrbrau1/23253/Bobra.0693s0001.1
MDVTWTIAVPPQAQTNVVCSMDGWVSRWLDIAMDDCRTTAGPDKWLLLNGWMDGLVYGGKGNG